MADFRVKVTAETKDAEQKLDAVNKAANKATKDRSIKLDVPSIGEISKSFTDLGKTVETAANDIKTFYGVARRLPGIGDSIKKYEQVATGTVKAAAAVKSNIKAGDILANSFEKATGTVGLLVNNLAKVGFALFGIKEIVGVLQGAFGGFFNETIGREVRLRETILKTQTTLASTSKVFKNGQEITDPFEKIVGLTGAVRQNIDSIRERSIALAGVTSNEVIEVFGIVASQISQIGGGLKEAEDLAINFSAALGTFGIPLYQARQEIGSILRGDITMDSYLAKALGITNQDVAKAKTQAGGVVKFLEERLAAAVAGQTIAAQGFAGVMSNIRDLGELVSQRFGAQLLDPLLSGLTAVFEALFRVREQLFTIADIAGGTIGRVATLGREVGARTGLVTTLQVGTGDRALNDVKDAVQDVSVMIEGAIQRAIGAVSQIINTVKPVVLSLVDAFVRLGKAFIEIKVGTFEALARALANVISFWSVLATQVANLFNVYTRLLDLPIIEHFARLAATFSLLKRTGLDFLTNVILIGVALRTTIIPVLGSVGVALGILIAGIGAVVLAVGKLTLTLAGLAAALTNIPILAGGVAKALLDVSKSLNAAGNQSVDAGNKINTIAGGFKNLGQTAKLAGLNIIKSMGWVFLVQAAITVVVDAIGEYQKASEEASRQKRAELALNRLSTLYKNVGDNADYATKAARDFERQLAQAEYSRTIERLEEIRKKLNDLQYEAKGGVQTWGELWRVLGRAAQGKTDPFNEEDGKDAAKLLAEQIRLRNYARKFEDQQNRENAKEGIKIEAQNRTNLEKEIAELRRQQENDIFQLRQSLAQKEVEIFRAAGELRIFQMEQANKKLIEGEEGASASALNALNVYLSTRERGELDIEAAKKSLVIEAANLEKQVADYRLENEKKIAEIRKRASENDQKMADYQRQAANQTAAGTGGGAATFGSTGNVDNAAGWVHGHFQTNNGSLSDLIRDVIPVMKSLLDKGIPVELSDGTRIQGGKDDTYYTQMLKKAAQQHRHSGDGRSLDLFVPEGTKVPVPLTNITGNTGRGGITGGLPGSGKSWVGHLAPGSKAGGAGPLAPPKLNNFDDIGAPAVQKYAAAVNSLSGAMGRLRALQEALTNAKTAAAFEEIAKAAFPKVGLEQYRDQIIEAEKTLEALASTANEAYDPEKLKIAVEQITKRKIQEDEIKQILNKAEQQRKAGTLTEVEFNKLKDSLSQKQKQYLLDLEREKKSREQILDLTRQQQAVTEVREATKKIDFDLKRSRVQGTVSMAESFAGDDPLLRRRIEAEAAIAQKRFELEEKYGEGSAKAQEELRKFSEATRKSAIELGLLDKTVTEFKERMSQIREAARAFTDGFKGFAKTLITGGDIREALVSMLQGISEKLLDTTLNAVFKPIEDALVRNLKDFFGVTDPTTALQAENNLALGINTAALDRLSAALTSAGLGAPANNLTFGPTTTLPSTLPDFNTSIDNLTSGFGDAALTLDGFSTEAAFTSKQFLEFGKYTAANTQALGFFGKGLMSVLQGISGGGTSGGGIFGTILSIAGSFLGGLGGGGSTILPSTLPDFNPAAVAFNPAAWDFRANGGPVSARSPYVVGERGPELFVPSSGGHIVPNSELGRGGSVSVVVNVDAKGSKVEGDDNRAKQLGAVLSTAIQQELIKQKRPGGLLS